MFRPLVPAALLALALPLAAQEAAPPPPPPAGPMERLAEELADRMLREMLGEHAPTLRELADLMGEAEHYGPPVLLPNGDILIPRRPDAPARPAPDAPAEEGAPPGEAIEL